MNKPISQLTKEELREMCRGYVFAKRFFYRRWSQLKPRTLLAIADIHESYGTLKSAGMGLYAKRLAVRKGGTVCKVYARQ
jgi:hypothetical protein